MKATQWEFTNRALVFGLILACAFGLYSFDHENATALLANWIEAKQHVNAELMARLLFSLAAIVLAAAALLRTWASAYLEADVVYAADVKTESLVADGPYRCVRNPLYFANILMAFAMGAMLSRSGYLLAVVAMALFCYRLILREEAELHSKQGASYDAYRRAVPRLWPSVSPRIRSARGRANWPAGFKAESWYWGFAAALLAFAITLKMTVFFGAMGASIALFWLSSTILTRGEARR